MTGKLALLAKAQMHQALRRCLDQHLKRGLIFANNTAVNGARRNTTWKLPDLTLFDIWALYARASGSWWTYPIVLLGDLQLLIGWLIKSKQENDIISFVIKFCLGREKMRTPFGTILAYLFRRQLLDILRRLESYWCGWRKQPGMYDLQAAYLRKILG